MFLLNILNHASLTVLGMSIGYHRLSTSPRIKIHVQRLRVPHVLACITAGAQTMVQNKKGNLQRHRFFFIKENTFIVSFCEKYLQGHIDHLNSILVKKGPLFTC